MLGEPPDREKKGEAYIKWVNEYAGEIATKLQHGSVLH